MVAKRRDSLCEPGRRTGAWVKAKLTRQQEFVIGGYTPPEGSRKYFEASLIGYYGAAGLLFDARVDNGFSEKALAAFYGGMQSIRRASCPAVTCQRKDEGAGAKESPLRS